MSPSDPRREGVAESVLLGTLANHLESRILLPRDKRKVAVFRPRQRNILIRKPKHWAYDMATVCQNRLGSVDVCGDIWWVRNPWRTPFFGRLWSCKWERIRGIHDGAAG